MTIGDSQVAKSRAERLQEAITVAQTNHAKRQSTAKYKAPIAKGPPSPTAEAFGEIYIRGAAAAPGRMKRWVEASARVFGFEDDPHLAFQLQECGFLDGLLLAFESETRTDPGPNPGGRYIAGQSFEFTIGDCWLLLAYEVLRVFRRSSRYAELPKNQQVGFDELYRLVSLVRMPLAKREAAKTRKGDTYVHNAPTRIMHDEIGTAGWRIFDKSNNALVDVLRLPLADALLLWSEGKLSKQAMQAVCADGSRKLIHIIKD